MSLRFKHVALLSTAALVAVPVVWFMAVAGVWVGVHNTGRGVLSDVVIRVAGDSGRVGDLAPGESRSVRVRPSGASHVEIEYRDQAGTPVRLQADCYFERSYRDTVDMDVADGRVVAVRDKTTFP